MRRLASSSWQPTIRTSCSLDRDSTTPDMRQSTSSTRVSTASSRIAPCRSHPASRTSVSWACDRSAPAKRLPSTVASVSTRPEARAAVKSPESATPDPVELVVEAVGQRGGGRQVIGQRGAPWRWDGLGAGAHSTPSCCNRRRAIHPGSIGSQNRSSRASSAAATAGPASTPAHDQAQHEHGLDHALAVGGGRQHAGRRGDEAGHDDGHRRSAAAEGLHRGHHDQRVEQGQARRTSPTMAARPAGSDAAATRSRNDRAVGRITRLR